MPRVRELPRFSVPGHCIMFPGRRRDDRGFFLFDSIIDGPNGDVHVGISAEGLRTIADRHGKEFGIVRREELDQAREVVRAAQAEIEELREQVEALQEFKDRISGLATDGFEIKRKMGRPPVKKESE